MAEVKEAIFDYWSRWAPRFDRSASHVRHPEAWRAVIAAAVPGTSLRCLDLGTGTGACALALAANGHHVVGLDGAGGMLVECRRVAAERDLAVALVQGDVEAAPFADAAFDIVAARNLFWTLPDPDRAMREIVRLLRPGGTFLFSDGLWLTDSVPPEASSHDMTAYAPLLDELPYHRGLSPEKARSLLAFHGFGTPSQWEAAFQVHPYQHQSTGARHFFVMTAARPAG